MILYYRCQIIVLPWPIFVVTAVFHPQTVYWKVMKEIDVYYYQPTHPNYPDEYLN